MEHACRGGRLETIHDLQDRVDRCGGRHRAMGLDDVFERAARRELHHDHQGAGDLFGREHIDAVGMVDRGGELPFAKEPGAFGRAGSV